MDRIELLHADDGGVFDLVRVAVVDEIEVDLAGAEHDAFGAFRGGDVGENFLEAAGREILDGRGAAGIAQHALGGHEHERLLDRAQGLTAQDVVVARGRRTMGDLDVVLGAGLEITLEARAGVFRSLAMVAVGQEENDAGGFAPLRFRADDILVDDELGAVGKIAELRFPEDEHVGEIEAVAVIEAEHRVFRERAVVDAELGLAVGDVVQRRIALARLHVVKDGVALGEGAAAAILTGEPDRQTTLEQCAEGEGFGGAPVERRLALDHVGAALKPALDLGIERDAIGILRDGGTDFLQLFHRNGGVDGIEQRGADE